LTDKPKRTVKQIDLTKPFVLTFEQTDSRNIVSVFTGEDAKAQGLAHASARAAKVKRPVAVIGPQTNLFQPPAAPEVVETQLEFDMG
jgi:hypothetical protein